MGAIGMQHIKLKRNLTIAGFALGTSIYIPTAQAEPYTLVTNVVWKLTESGDLQVDLGGRFHVIERGQFLIDGADLYINRNEISDVDWSSLIAAGAVVSSAGGLWLFAALASGNGEAAQAISGVAIKGPLNNAFVFLDENGNETFDVGELSTTTNSTGGFDLSVGSRTGEIFVITNDNTIDTATGAMLSGVTLRSSMDSTVVSPLTTLMVSADLSSQEISSLLGITAQVDLKTFNPFAAGVDASAALEIEKASVATLSTVVGFAESAVGAGAAASVAYDAAYEAFRLTLEAKQQAGQQFDFTNSGDLAQFQGAFRSEIQNHSSADVDALDRISGQVVDAVINTNTAVLSLNDTVLSNNADTFGLLQVLKDQSHAAASDEAASQGSGIIALSDANNVATLVQNQAPTDAQLSNSTYVAGSVSLVVGTVSVTDDNTDPGNFRFALGNDANSDNALFSIDPSTGELAFLQNPDENVADSLTVLILITDEGGKTLSQTLSIDVVPSNNLPVFSSGSSASLSENATDTGYTASATDADGDAVTYSLSGGADQSLFAIDSATGALSFQVAPDFDIAGDDDGDNVYEVVIEASDGNGGTATQNVSVTVSGLNDNLPVFSSGSSASLSENATDTGYTASATDADGDAVTYSLSGGADQSLFAIDSATGALSFQVAPDFDIAGDDDGDNVYEVVIEASDGNGGTATQNVSVTVSGLNDNLPVFSSGSSASLSENATDTGYTASATDADGDAVTYSLSGGADQSLFAIDSATGALSFQVAPDFDIAGDDDGDNVYEVVIEASDGNGGTATQNVSVTVSGLNDNLPVFSSGSSASLSENATDTGYTASATDADGDAVTYSLSGGADQSLFAIDSATGALSFQVAPDFDIAGDDDGDNVYEVIIEASDGTYSATQSVSVTVSGLNDNLPVFSSGSSASLSENATDTGYTASATDADGDAVTYSLSGGADQSLFAIDSATGALSFQVAPDFDIAGDDDGDNVYEVVIEASDGNGGTATQNVSVTVSGLNDNLPVFSSGSSASLSENATDTGYTASATDADGDAVTYSLSGGADQSLFAIDSATGALSFQVAPDFDIAGDDDGDNVYEVIIEASDGNGGTATQNVSVTVSGLNDNLPVFSSGSSASLSENATDTGYTASATDADGDAVTYSLSGGADQSLFAIDSATGALSFQVAPDFDIAGDDDGDNVYEVVIEASDGNGGTATQSVSVTVSGLNDNLPVFSSGSSASLSENATDTGYTASATDADGDAVTYSLSGGADQSLFAIDSATGALSFQVAPDFDIAGDDDGDNVYEVIIEASDGTYSATQSVSVTVSGLNDNLPVFSSGSSASLSENATDTGYTASATDADGDAVTYSLSGGADQSLFAIDSATGALSFQVAPDFDIAGDDDGDNVYEVVIEASDGNGGTATQNVSVTVSGLNDNLPVFSSGSSASLSENATDTGYTASATDADGDAVTYSLSGGADQSLFAIDSATGALSFQVAPDFDIAGDDDGDNVYEVIIEASDGNGGTATQNVSVTVSGLNDNLPVFSSGSSASLSENATDTGYTASATDADGDAVTYSLSGGADQSLFAIDSATGALSFQVAPDFDIAGDDDGDNVYEVVIEASDGNGGTATQNVSVTVSGLNDNLPVFSSGSSASLSENATDTGYTASATDADGDAVTYSLSGGADQSLFAIDSATGALSFQAPRDFETPGDDDGDNVYEVVIEASDGNGGTATQNVSVTVQDVGLIQSFGDDYESHAQSASVAATNDNDSLTFGTQAFYGGNGVLTIDLYDGNDQVIFGDYAAVQSNIVINGMDGDKSVSLGSNATYLGGSIEINNDSGDMNVSVADRTGPLWNSHYRKTFEFNLGTGNHNVSLGHDVVPFGVAYIDTGEGESTIELATAGVGEALDARQGQPSAVEIDLGETSDVDVIKITEDASGFLVVHNYQVGVDAKIVVPRFTTGGLDAVNHGRPGFTFQGTQMPSYLTVGLHQTDAMFWHDDMYVVLLGLYDEVLAGGSNVLDYFDLGVSWTSGQSLTISDGTTVTTYFATAIDGDGDGLTYSIVGGDDSSDFEIDPTTGELSFVEAPLGSNPTDANQDNVYEVEILASDGAEDFSSQMVSITVVPSGVNLSFGGSYPTDTQTVNGTAYDDTITFSDRAAWAGDYGDDGNLTVNLYSGNDVLSFGPWAGTGAINIYGGEGDKDISFGGKAAFGITNAGYISIANNFTGTQTYTFGAEDGIGAARGGTVNIISGSGDSSFLFEGETSWKNSSLGISDNGGNNDYTFTDVVTNLNLTDGSGSGTINFQGKVGQTSEGYDDGTIVIDLGDDTANDVLIFGDQIYNTTVKNWHVNYDSKIDVVGTYEFWYQESMNSGYTPVHFRNGQEEITLLLEWANPNLNPDYYFT